MADNDSILMYNFLLSQGVLTRLTVLLVHNPIENSVPSSRCGHLKQQDHALAECLEVVNLVEGTSQLYGHEEAHAKDGKYEHNKEE